MGCAPALHPSRNLVLHQVRLLGAEAVLTGVRRTVGPDCSIMAVHDLHCNLTQEMADAADVLVVERTYPHVDMAERAMHA